ncbi:type VII toxin-antitoxin system MntA family adenylyltransferase antitoxin [Geoalkalibacter subterraneus]|uniref:Polymerase beta nucleotidyltransferase domain-containing protein n=1 Tax=Geoalkalibacter subterraneus TaxID=483547 RepID=A0A0B5FTP9_9BACT|nr:nucleotidyltransferase domain-containing protein [Geoalkalibacter subterraneus]AJF07540.1 hypothetical protein GSUB_14655 [Geoalkalibacter subterraneus]
MDHMIVQCLREAVPDLLAVYRFGSFGTDAERLESDLDIAFLAEASPSHVKRWRLAQEMATMFGREVDLIDLAQATTVFRMQVIAHGRRIWCADEVRVETYADYVFSSYARLNEERRWILQDIRERGNIYGG